jgi:hypothetical protein
LQIPEHAPAAGPPVLCLHSVPGIVKGRTAAWPMRKNRKEDTSVKNNPIGFDLPDSIFVGANIFVDHAAAIRRGNTSSMWREEDNLHGYYLPIQIKVHLAERKKFSTMHFLP